MEKKEWKKKVFSRKGVSLISQILIIALAIGLFILGDYITFQGSMAFATDPIYWITTTISLILVVALMITVRNMRKDKRVEVSETIQNNMKTVQAVRKVVLINAYDDDLQVYIDKVNEDYKYETYINKITKKINRLNGFWGKFIKKAKKEQKLLDYEKQLKVPKEEVLKMHIKFDKITQTALFSGVDGKLAVMSKFDINTHNTKDIVNMTGYKAMIVYLLTAFSGTLMVSFIFGGWAVLWGTLLKIFSAVFSTNSAIRQADNFVDYNIEQALDNRLRIILGFVNSNAEVKSKVLEKLADDEKVLDIEK